MTLIDFVPYVRVDVSNSRKRTASAGSMLLMELKGAYRHAPESFIVWNGFNIEVRHNSVTWDYGEDGAVSIAQPQAARLIIAFEAVTELQSLRMSQAPHAAFISVLEHLAKHDVGFGWLEPRPLGFFSRLLKPDKVWGCMRVRNENPAEQHLFSPSVYLGLATSWDGSEQRLSFGAKRPINAFDGQKYSGMRQTQFIERSIAALRQAVEA